MLELKDKSRIIKYLAEREINEISYKSMKEQAEYILQKFNIDICCSGVQISELTKIKLIRNILVHNKGIINSTFLELIQEPYYREGERLEIAYEFWKKSKFVLESVVSYLKDEVVEKFG